MTHKTKVIAVRVTQEQYDGLMALKGDMRMGNYLYACLLPTLRSGEQELQALRKKAEARAKRIAKKEAASGL
jgi:hypothetical protein